MEFASKWNSTLVEPKHPVLHNPAGIDPLDTDIVWQTVEQEMFKLMHERIGIGLAAPQLGNPVKMFVMTHSELGDIAVYNPKIINVSEEKTCMEEGCLTFPGLFFHVTRPEGVQVSFQDRKGNEQILELDGMDSRCFQHETDHIHGILNLTYISDFKLQRAIQKRDKLVKKYSNMKKSIKRV
jgi:peptide deformylase